MSTDASIASLIDLTALSAEQASTLLAAAGGDLDLAVALHFDDTTLPFLPAAEPPPLRRCRSISIRTVYTLPLLSVTKGARSFRLERRSVHQTD